ncbi:hypothetical protein [Flavobacterium adhaerens]|uniref:hypothetical protein n=1 Tax=Flavobacterium adhaerens TaxID=3149043 RepID=UPI0032B4E133
MFSLFRKKPKEYSKIESHIFGIITELLKLSSTDINCDELGARYYLSNEEQHFRVTIYSEDSVIRLTNTHDSVAEKYSVGFVKDVLSAVKEEKHRRMELVCGSITTSIEAMAERMHNKLLEQNEAENQTIKLVKTESYSNRKKANY